MHRLNKAVDAQRSTVLQKTGTEGDLEVTAGVVVLVEVARTTSMVNATRLELNDTPMKDKVGIEDRQNLLVDVLIADRAMVATRRHRLCINRDQRNVAGTRTRQFRQTIAQIFGID